MVRQGVKRGDTSTPGSRAFYIALSLGATGTLTMETIPDSPTE